MLSKGRALCANNKSLTLFSAKLNFSSNYDEQSESSYESFKKVARKTGDAAKEWMVGSRETGSTPYKQSKRNTQQSYETMKRAMDDEGNEKDNNINGHHQDSEEQQQQQQQQQHSNNTKVGIKSARATWRETRDEEKKGHEHTTRKSQLTDEAFGDNPKDITPSKEKQISESEPVGHQ